MATQYTSILKLALPVTGELSGTWGDVVNDNITSMVEEAIAGRAAIDTWTANSHILTTADGTTSEARAAILTLTDTGTALTGAGTVICPAASKIYIVENGAGQTITVKTASGTGIAVPDGKNMVVFCDGTNVEEGITNINSLTLNGDGATVSSIKDEDNMASDSATALATQQSIKAYVDTQIGVNNELSEVLANGNTTGGTDISVSSGDDITFADNGKAIFGAGSDLQIYHDGGHSYIDDAGTGLLRLRSNTVYLEKYTGELLADFNADGYVSLLHDNSEKFRTTSTGIDVTGTVTADGLTVDGDATVQTTSGNTSTFLLGQSGVRNWRFQNTATSGDLEIKPSPTTSAMAITANGDISFYEDTGTTPKLTWDASAESLNFADNGKAIFGAGGDLEIYSDGSTSYIREAGPGNLRIAGAGVQITDPSFNKYFLGSGDIARLYHSDDQKLATSATGIDVTGTVTADGLDASAGDITTTSIGFNGSRTTTPDGLSYPIIWRSASAHPDFNSGDLVIQARSDADRDIHFVTGNTPTERMNIDGQTGDISFYNSAGNLQALFWDASTERLGLGTSSPGATLDVDGTVDIAPSSGDAQLKILNSANTGRSLIYFSDPGGTGGRMVYNHAANFMSFETNGTNEAMRIDASGNVGIGNSSPGNFNSSAERLVIGGGAGDEGMTVYSSPTGRGSLFFADATSGTALYAGYVQYSHSSNNMVFGTDSTTKVTLTSSGNLGIGTSSPARALHISTSADRIAKFESTDASAFIVLEDSNSTSDYNRIGVTTHDMQFITNNSEAMRIDSSGNVGIGTSSPSTKLHIKDTSNAEITIQDAVSSATARIGVYGAGGSLTFDTNSGGSHIFTTNNRASEAMRIDASGNTLFGTTLTPVQLSTTSNNADQGVGISSSGLISGANEADVVLSLNRLGTDGAIASFRKNGSQVGAIGTNSGSLFIGSGDTGLNMRADLNAIYPWGPTGGAQPDVIDLGYSTVPFKDLYLSGTSYSNTVLVGKTSVNQFTTAGHELHEDGLYVATRDSGNVAVLNRETNDGSILQFRKDNSTVGSIGSNSDSGSKLYIGSAESAIKFKTNAIVPANSVGSNNNDDINLGENGTAFKDLYLSGGVFLGGVGSANKLDDYEEGTFTPVYEPQNGSFTTMTMDVIEATYVKVGKAVTINLWVRTDNVDVTGASGSLKITGLPFNASSYGSFAIGNSASFAGDDPAFAFVNYNLLTLQYKSAINADPSNVSVTDLATGATANQNQLMLSGTYFTT